MRANTSLMQHTETENMRGEEAWQAEFCTQGPEARGGGSPLPQLDLQALKWCLFLGHVLL